MLQHVEVLGLTKKIGLIRGDRIIQLRQFLRVCTIFQELQILFKPAEILLLSGTWKDWPDLPIRLYCSDNTLLSVSWSKFDDLWLSNDNSLPFAAEDATTRWKSNGIEKIIAAIGKRIRGVSLGRGEMSIESRDIEIWTRLLFDLGGPWLEVFNALDENGYDLHLAKPEGEFRQCT